MIAGPLKVWMCSLREDRWEDMDSISAWMICVAVAGPVEVVVEFLGKLVSRAAVARMKRFVIPIVDSSCSFALLLA